MRKLAYACVSKKTTLRGAIFKNVSRAFSHPTPVGLENFIKLTIKATSLSANLVFFYWKLNSPFLRQRHV